MSEAEHREPPPRGSRPFSSALSAGAFPPGPAPAGEVAAVQAAGGDHAVVEVAERPDPVRAHAVEQQVAEAVEAQPARRHPVRSGASVRTPAVSAS